MRIKTCGVFRLRLPFRFAFRHHSAERRFTDNLIVRLVLEDGSEGYGEGVPREYVTGETPLSAARAISGVYLPDLSKLDPVSFGEAAWAAAGLRVVRDGPVVFNSARCAVELALLDAYGKAFGAGLEELKNLLPGIGGEGGSSSAAPTAVLPFLGRFGFQAAYRFFRLCGYRSFKVKLGRPEEQANWSLTESLARRTRGGRIVIRADANGAWTAEEAPALLDRLARMGVASAEQPVPGPDLPLLIRPEGEKRNIAVVADESLRTAGEAEKLAAGRICDGFQIRLSKCGGLFPSLQIVEVARRHGLGCHLGAMVGETGILAAAQSFFLDIAPGLDSFEPSLSRLILRRNVARRPSALGGLTGPWPRQGTGLGIEINRKIFRRFVEKLSEQSGLNRPPETGRVPCL